MWADPNLNSLRPDDRRDFDSLSESHPTHRTPSVKAFAAPHLFFESRTRCKLGKIVAARTLGGGIALWSLFLLVPSFLCDASPLSSVTAARSPGTEFSWLRGMLWNIPRRHGQGAHQDLQGGWLEALNELMCVSYVECRGVSCGQMSRGHVMQMCTCAGSCESAFRRLRKSSRRECTTRPLRARRAHGMRAAHSDGHTVTVCREMWIQCVFYGNCGMRMVLVASSARIINLRPP